MRFRSWRTLPRSEAVTRSWIAPRSPDLVWFTGSDAERFLNDLISQEIGEMVLGEARRSLLLGPDGKLDHLLWVIKSDHGFGLVTDPGRGAELATTLGRYRIRVDVEITREPRPVWLVMGEGVGYGVSWSGQPRRLLVGDRPDLPSGSKSEYEAARIAAGEPEWGRDVDEKTIPHETGLVSATVDFSKGCYLGQELVARIDARGGNVPRPLRRLVADGELEEGAALTAEDTEVGRVTTAAGRVGLGVVKRSVEPGTAVEADGLRVVVGDLH